MNRNRRKLLIISIACFIVSILCITGAIFEVRSCYAGQEHSHCLERFSDDGKIYIMMTCEGESAHIYWATYDIAYNHGSIKTNEGTHSGHYMNPKNRPAKYDDNGVTPEFLKWLSKLNYAHLTMKGEKLILFTNRGVNNTSRTEKSGQYYYYIWRDDATHDRYVKWCKNHGVKLSH